jgi:hypothetical protein
MHARLPDLDLVTKLAILARSRTALTEAAVALAESAALGAIANAPDQCKRLSSNCYKLRS